VDFTLSDEQQALADLAGQILGDQLPPERLSEIERGDDWFAADCWKKLAEAGLCGVAVPEAFGGLGFGVLELALVLEQVGRTVAPVPLLATAGYAALPLAEFGSAEQQATWLPGVADGSIVLTAALGPGTVSATDDSRLTGTVDFVPAAHLAACILVPARDRVFLVDPTDVSMERQETTSLEPQWRLTLDGVAGDPLGPGGGSVLEWLAPRAVALHCAVQAGVCAQALRLTADYVSTREQFGTPIGTFQAVGQRAADAYIDTEAVRLTMLQAAWRLSEGLPADDAVAVAKFWAAEGAQRVVHAAQHLHGGIGVDTDYPVHRYFRWAKVHELTLGGASEHLLALGRLLASD
jgi:alkylation response protein AidB-like acyl-CoA dehydrogenase